MASIATRPRGASPAAAEGASADRFRAVRASTRALCEPLAPEDMVPQSMPDASPAKWHLAHTTWFFETFVLADADPDHRAPDPAYAVLFNSYYNGIGEQYDRPSRGLITRPTVDEVLAYRERVDRAMGALYERHGGALPAPLAARVELGLNHEQQHQELLLTDLLHLWSKNPLNPAYRAPDPAGGKGPEEPPVLRWSAFEAGLSEFGHAGPGFAFDNEAPRHRRFVEAFELADRPVTEGEFLAFVEDGGYECAELWLSDGWATVRTEGWRAPLYWRRRADGWRRFGLRGEVPLHPARPVAQLSYYEADAYARWAGARLPTEFEWERAAARAGEPGAFVEDGELAPRLLCDAPEPLARLYGDVWEWTASGYEAYPRFRPAPGAVGEYNGKFMCSQRVLRGGSCATPRDHVRSTYRNFFYPHQRWQFSGLRLARDARG